MYYENEHEFDYVSLTTKDVKSITDWMEGVVHALYTTGDKTELERCLEELCCELDIELPKSSMKEIK